MSKSTGFYPSLTVDTAGTGVVSQAGAVLLVETVRKVGLDRVLSSGLGRWRAPTAIHDPGKVLCDLVISVALGGDCLADIATVRAEPGVFGLVASDPTVSRLIDTLARTWIRRWPPWPPPGCGPGPGHGRWPVTTPRTTASAPTIR